MRKKSLAELMRERANQSTDTSVYTDKPVEKINNTNNTDIKSQVDNLYKRNDNSSQSLWDRVQARATNIMNTTKQAQEMTKNYFNNSKLGQSINTYKNNFEEDKRNLKKHFGDTVQNTLTKGLNKNIKIDETRFINKNYTQEKEDSSREMLNIHSSEYMKSKALKKENNLSIKQLPISIRNYKKSDNTNLLLPKKQDEETWGDKLSNATKKDVIDTISYLPQVGKGAILGGKQGLEEASQYLTETVQKQTNDSYKLINNQRKNLSKEIAIRNDISNIDNENIGKNLFQIAKEGDQEKINSIIQEAPNVVAKKLSELAPSTGRTLAGTAIGAIPGVGQGLSSVYFFSSSGQSYFDSAKERGMNDNDAWLYSGLMATWETASEHVITGERANQIKAILTGKEFDKSVMNILGNEILENAVQEGLTEYVDDFATKVSGGNEFIKEGVHKRALKSVFDGALQGSLLGLPTSALKSASSVKNYVQQQIQEKGEKVVANEMLLNARQTLAKIESNVIDQIENIENNSNIQNQQTTINNNEVLNNSKQITQEQNKTTQNVISEQIKVDSENFAKQVDGITKGKLPKKNMLTLLSQTPQALQDIGLSNYPITMTSKHLDTIMNESGNIKGANYHNLGEDIIKQLPEAIANPLDIVKSNTKDDSVVLTTYLADKQDRTIIASIKINGTGLVNDIIIDTNVMTSAYGRNNYEKFMEDNIKNGNLLYDIDRGVIKRVDNPRLQLSSFTNSSVDTVDNVSTTNNIIQQNKNYDNSNEKITQIIQNSNISDRHKNILSEYTKENNLTEKEVTRLIQNQQVKDKIKSEKYSNSENAKEFFESAVRNGIDISNKNLESLYDLPNARGIKTKFDTETFKDSNGNIKQDINAVYVTDREGNRSIIYNPNAYSDTITEKNAIHETFHDMTGTKQSQEVIDYVYNKMKNDKDFMEAFDSLKETYSNIKDSDGNILYNTKSQEFEDMIKEEAAADYLGTNLGTQEYINELVNGKESRNIAQKIYDVIVKFLDKVTGYKSEEAYLRGLKNKFEKAFNADYISRDSNQRFSIQIDKQGNKYVNIDVDQDIFDGKSVKEQTQIAKEYILDNFRKNGLFKNNENIKISRKTALEYTHPKNSLDTEVYSSKMKASTELNNLLEISQYIKSETDDGRHIFAKNGWDYYETVFKVGDKKYSGWLNIAKGDKGKLLYDITNIKERASNYNVKTVSVANSSSINSIPQSNKNGNTNIKYSMQDNKNNAKLSQNAKGKWQEYLEKHKINKEGTRTTLNELKLPEAKRNLPTVRESQYQDSINNAVYIPKDVKTELLTELDGVEKNAKSLREFESIVEEMNNAYKDSNQSSSFSLITETGNPAIDNKSNEYKRINDKIKTMMPMSKEQRETYYNNLGNSINKIKDNYNELQKRKENLEKSFDLEVTSSEDWINISDELSQIEEEQAIVKAKIDEIENIPDTINNIVRQRTYEKKKKGEKRLEYQKAWANEYAEIDDLAQKTKNKRLSVALDNFIGSTQSVEKTISGNTKFGTGQTDIKGNLKGASLVERLKPIYKNKNMMEFSDYSQLKLNIERLKQGKPNLSNITKTQCEVKIAEYESKYPYFKEIHNSIEEFLSNELQNAVDAGLGTQDMYDKVREMYPSYMPIFKNFTDLRNLIDNGEITTKMIKRAVGGETEILALDVACTEYAMGMRRKIALNNVLVELKNSLEKQNQLQDYVNTEMTNSYDDFSNILEQKGNEVLMEDIDGNKIATCYIDGIAHQFKIPDNYYNLLKRKDIKETKFGQELISFANNAFRKMVTTYNPAFTIRNAIKDFQSGLYNTKYTAPVYIKNYTKAIQQILTNGEYYQKYKNAGMQGNTVYSKKNGLLISENQSIIKKAISMPTNAIEFINTQFESAGRLSEFISSLETGNDIDTAKYDASEVTLNFKSGGTASKAITRCGATFFNSSVLAVEKTIKNVTGKNGVKGMANFIVNGMISGVGLSLLNHLMYKDDDDYEELQDYIKDGYFLIKKNDGSGDFYRISKEQLNTAIGSTTRRIYQMVSGEEDIDELGDMFKTIFDNIGVNNPITNNIYAPLGQAIFNKSWYDGEIVSESQQELAPEAQYDYRTNEVSKTVANGIARMPEAVKETVKGLPIASQAYDILSSPKKSNYVTEQYLGGIGKILLPMATPYAEQNYLEKEMLTNSTLKSKYPGEVYDLLDEISEEYKTYGTNEDKFKYLSEATGIMSDYYKQIRELENDENISNENKRKKEMQIRKKLNQYAKDVLNDVKNTKGKNGITKIGDTEYYKDSEGETKKVDKDKSIKLPTRTFADYSNKIQKATKKKREETGKEKAQLNNREKISILHNSKYSEEEKRDIYVNHINDDDETYNVISKLENENTNIDAYLDYKLQYIKSDEDTKSNVHGKKVSKGEGTAKSKTLDYIYNSKMTDLEKAYIIETKYANVLDEKARQQLLDLVSKTITDKEELEEVLSKFKDLEKHKDDGNWYWKK